jgi:glycerol-3-phosphate acyltransferase PlsY
MAKARKGIDIRDVDVLNMGAGAIFRIVGFWEGIIVLIFDIGKGAAAIILAQELGLSQFWIFGTGFASILGHCFPAFIGFRGGQGVATTIGIFLILAPVPTAVTLIILGIALLATRHLFSAIAISSPSLPVFLWLFGSPIVIIVYSLLVIAFIIFRSRHRLHEVKDVRTPSVKK